MKKILCPFAAAILLFAGCGNDEESKPINKSGAIETSMTVTHLDDKRDVIITSHLVWINNEQKGNIIHRDTVPSLGMTYQEGENAEGATKMLPVKKDYEIYITVK